MDLRLRRGSCRVSSRCLGAVRPVLVLAIGGLSLAWILAATALPAHAAPKGVVDTIGEDVLVDPVGVAVNDTTGDVYVTEQYGGHVVRRFSSSGELLSSFGGQGAE